MSLPGIPKGRVAKVDCGDCHACCQGMLVILDENEGDDVSDARGDWKWNKYGPMRVRQMKTKGNGDCVHLTKDGCDIYEARPAICKYFDCVGFVSSRANLEACSNGPVIAEGRRRLAARASKLNSLKSG